jgi:CDP-diglyceride synthetase
MMTWITAWLVDHRWLTYIIIYAFLIYVYNKVFRVRKLPILKDLIIYLLIGVGAFLLLVFQVDLQLPIVPCLAMAVLLMLVVRVRYFFESLRNRKT